MRYTSQHAVPEHIWMTSVSLQIVFKYHMAPIFYDFCDFRGLASNCENYALQNNVEFLKTHALPYGNKFSSLVINRCYSIAYKQRSDNKLPNPRDPCQGIRKYFGLYCVSQSRNKTPYLGASKEGSYAKVTLEQK